MDIRFSGFGGQGIIKSGILIGKAASLYDNKFGTMTQSFGPEARGGACSAQVVIDDDPVLYPYIVAPEILVSMSQEAYEKFIGDPVKGSIVLTDTDLVKPATIRKDVKLYSIPATRVAEEMGNRIFANVVMVGFFLSITRIISLDAMKKALPGSVPDRFIEINIEALERGYNFGLELLEKETSTKKA
ncbi:MAG: 2-oxoacid:acceptor oxidoreductase family protein [Candidatus Marinimicrobia bacterium]|nr:2-oxoacid:acceptor oxidoreductase family protein [Candidatus Neomarinimicrobiota bacterium]MBL7059604.1 2-oxoacid:acceptor oxidoreductase family protein [Candidatus Neomarinimicrobiota bacterium]